MTAMKKILVVDDDLDICDSYQAILQKAGYHVDIANSAAQGMKLVAANRPDIILLDVMMDEPDEGFKMATRLAKEQPKIPVVLCSAISDASSHVFDTGSLGAAEIINKPVAPDKLIETVRRLLGEKI